MITLMVIILPISLLKAKALMSLIFFPKRCLAAVLKSIMT